MEGESKSAAEGLDRVDRAAYVTNTVVADLQCRLHFARESSDLSSPWLEEDWEGRKSICHDLGRVRGDFQLSLILQTHSFLS